MEQWNNVELSDLSKKSYTLNHDYDSIRRNSAINNNEAIKTSNGEEKPCEFLQPGSDIKPKVTTEDVESMLRRLYGITILEMKELISYDDRNYYIKEDMNIKNPLIICHCSDGYVFKILNALDSKKTEFVDGQNQLMTYLVKQNIKCPRPIANVNGKTYSVENINGTDHIVRLLDFVPGKIFHEVEITNYLLFQSGEYLAKIDRAMKNFNHVAYDTHKSTWHLQSVPKLRDFIYVIQDYDRKALVEEIIDAFEKNVLSKIGTMEKQVIHGDFNEHNIVVNPVNTVDLNSTDDSNPKEYRVTGIIDFGDTNKSPIIFEIGIAMTYMMLQAKNLESGGIFLAGYNSTNPIKYEEKLYLKYCIAARLAQSLVMGIYTNTLEPANTYVLVTQEQGWKLIEELWRKEFETIDETWQKAGDKYLTQSVK